MHNLIYLDIRQNPIKEIPQELQNLRRRKRGLRKRNKKLYIDFYGKS